MAKIKMAKPSLIYERWKEEHDRAIAFSMQSGNYIGGKSIDKFILEMSNYLSIEADNICTCANGSDALLIVYQSIGLKKGDEIIMPSLNYIASAESAIRLGLTPVFADTSKDELFRYSISFDHEYLDSLISPNTKAIVAVNLYGIPANIPKLKSYAESRNLILIEDNAQAFGGYIEEDKIKKPTGVNAHISTSSFFPTKPLSAMGDGGMIISQNKEWIKTARSIASHGQSSLKYDYKRIGMNSRLDAIQAEILRVRLRHIDEIIDSYNFLADRYSSKLGSLVEVLCPKIAKGYRATYYQYIVLIQNERLRNNLFDKLRAEGIDLQLYYPQNLDEIEVLKAYSVKKDELKLSSDINKKMLSLPIYPFMDTKDQDFVIKILEEQLINQKKS